MSKSSPSLINTQELGTNASPSFGVTAQRSTPVDGIPDWFQALPPHVQLFATSKYIETGDPTVLINPFINDTVVQTSADPLPPITNPGYPIMSQRFLWDWKNLNKGGYDGIPCARLHPSTWRLWYLDKEGNFTTDEVLSDAPWDDDCEPDWLIKAKDGRKIGLSINLSRDMEYYGISKTPSNNGSKSVTTYRAILDNDTMAAMQYHLLCSYQTAIAAGELASWCKATHDLNQTQRELGRGSDTFTRWRDAHPVRSQEDMALGVASLLFVPSCPFADRLRSKWSISTHPDFHDPSKAQDVPIGRMRITIGEDEQS